MIRLTRWKCVICGLLSTLVVLFPSMAFAEEMLIPIGQTVGITLNMKGITVTDIADIECYDGSVVTPAKDAGICAGDVIKSINGKPMQSVKDFEEFIHVADENNVEIVILRDGKEKSISIQPAQSVADGKFRLGVRVKDAVSGIGTITYYNPNDGSFGGLGHGITEKTDETSDLFDGEILDARIVSIQKGGKGQPGELVGVFTEQDDVLGIVTKNSEVGIKGTAQSDKSFDRIMEPIPVARRNEVKTGKAEILSNIEEGKIERFSIKIQKINQDSNNPRGMVIKITDDRLLEKTGGIVQGMSGSPIIQDGKLVGAVTHVFVNDPTRGYGIFIENMLSSK